jgi:hypothetical protein
MKTLQIYGENWVNNAELTVTSGEQSKAALCDRRPETQWQSSGSDDIVTETLEINFRNNSGASALRATDRILLLGTNVKNMSASYKNADGNWQAIPEAAISGNTTGNVLIEMAAPVTAEAVKLFLHTTQTANAEKTVGELKICKAVCALDAWIEFDKAAEYKQGSYYLASGKLVTWREYRKISGGFTLSRVTKAQRDILNAAFAGYRYMTYVFYADYDLAETFEFAVDGETAEEFDRVSERYTIKFKVQEL